MRVSICAVLRSPAAWLSPALSMFALGFLGCGESSEQQVTNVDATDTQFGEIDATTSDTRPEIYLPPDFGDLCEGNSDCSSGFCVEGPNGFVCTRTCDELCPDGWNCKGVQSGDSDVRFVCVPNGTATDTVGGDTTPDTSTGDTGTGDTGTGDTGTGDTGTGDTGGDTAVTEDTSADTNTNDTGPGPTLGNACEGPLGVGSDTLRTEGTVMTGEWPDCVVGCDFESNPSLWYVDLRSSNYTGASGRLDGDEHLYDFSGGQKVGPDIDVVAIIAPPRTMLELAVVKSAAQSVLEPLIYVSDGFQVRTFNSDVSGSNTCGRTTIAFPYISGLPIYAVLEEATNYDLWTPTGYGSGTVGGPGYDWILRIRTAIFQPFELGALAIGQTKTVTGSALIVGGQTSYFRFYAPGTSKPKVTITRKSGVDFLPTLAGMKTIQGELVWQKVEEDTDENGIVILTNTGFRPCVPQSECPSGFSCPPDLCTSADAEWIFAVYDYNGAAGPGTYGYDVKVEVLP